MSYIEITLTIVAVVFMGCAVFWWRKYIMLLAKPVYRELSNSERTCHLLREDLQAMKRERKLAQNKEYRL